LFSNKSLSERGTLYQLKNSLHGTRVPTDPGDNMKASEDFLLAVLPSHIKTATNSILCGTEAKDVMALSKTIVDRFVDFNLPSSSSPPVNHTDKSKIVCYGGCDFKTSLV